MKKLVLGLSIAAMTLAASSSFAAPLYFLDHNNLPASGSVASWDGATAMQSWQGDGQPMVGPTVETIGGQKWSKNVNRDNVGNPWDGVNAAPGSSWGQWDGYRLADHPASIALSGGATFVVAAKRGEAKAANNWQSIIDVMYDKLTLGIANDGRISVRRNGSLDFSDGTIAVGQSTILSMVTQADGSFEVWADGVSMLSRGASGTMTEWDKNRMQFFDQPDWATQGVAVNNWDGWWASVGLASWDWAGWNAKTQAERDAAWGFNAPVEYFKGSINVGRNDPDGWTAFNGSIGDVKIWTSALSGADRLAEVSAMQTAMGMGGDPVPEPGTILAALSILGPAGLLFRRRKF